MATLQRRHELRWTVSRADYQSQRHCPVWPYWWPRWYHFCFIHKRWNSTKYYMDENCDEIFPPPLSVVIIVNEVPTVNILDWTIRIFAKTKILKSFFANFTNCKLRLDFPRVFIVSELEHDQYNSCLSSASSRTRPSTRVEFAKGAFLVSAQCPSISIIKIIVVRSARERQSNYVGDWC